MGASDLRVDKNINALPCASFERRCGGWELNVAPMPLCSAHRLTMLELNQLFLNGSQILLDHRDDLWRGERQCRCGGRESVGDSMFGGLDRCACRSTAVSDGRGPYSVVTRGLRRVMACVLLVFGIAGQLVAVSRLLEDSDAGNRAPQKAVINVVVLTVCFLGPAAGMQRRKLAVDAVDAVEAARTGLAASRWWWRRWR